MPRNAKKRKGAILGVAERPAEDEKKKSFDVHFSNVDKGERQNICIQFGNNNVKEVPLPPPSIC
jgi:hypothetical protein